MIYEIVSSPSNLNDKLNMTSFICVSIHAQRPVLLMLLLLGHYSPRWNLDQPSQRRATYRHRMNVNKHHAPSGVRNHDPIVWACEDSSCLRPRSAVMDTIIGATINFVAKMEGVIFTSTTKLWVIGSFLLIGQFVHLYEELMNCYPFMLLKQAKWGNTNINVINLWWRNAVFRQIQLRTVCYHPDMTGP
jgi:hypothetical protein